MPGLSLLDVSIFSPTETEAGQEKGAKVCFDWLKLSANNDVEALETPIGLLPKYEDLKKFITAIDEEYPKPLYDMQLSIFLDNIMKRIVMQTKESCRETIFPKRLFAVYSRQKEELLAQKGKFGAIVALDKLS